jgi:Tol biopolymer transport system component
MKSPCLRTFSFLCVLLVLGSAAFAAGNAGRLTVDRYLDWEDVADPQLSPDGRQIVYERRWIDKINDRWETSLWITNADGSKKRFLVD